MVRCGLELGNRILQALICSFRCLFVHVCVHSPCARWHERCKGEQNPVRASAGASSAEKPDLSFFFQFISHSVARGLVLKHKSNHIMCLLKPSGPPRSFRSRDYKLVRTGTLCYLLGSSLLSSPSIVSPPLPPFQSTLPIHANKLRMVYIVQPRVIHFSEFKMICFAKSGLAELEIQDALHQLCPIEIQRVPHVPSSPIATSQKVKQVKSILIMSI